MRYISDIKLEKNKCCAVSGHRIITEKINETSLKNIFIKLIESGYDTFLIGMAIGFDILCFNLLEEIKKDKKIKIIACIPCLDQSDSFTEEQFNEYVRALNRADERVLISKEYSSYCMIKRNEFMVDKSSVLVAYLKEEKGGTAYTVNYAKNKKINVILIDYN